MLKSFGLVLLSFFLSINFYFIKAQCHNPNFTVTPNSSCGTFNIQNLTTGSVKQEWDFSTGDLLYNPNRVPGFSLLDGRGLNIVKDENTGNYFGFTLSASAGMVRLNFGSSLNNTPATTTLGTFGGLITTSILSNLALAYDGTNWFGYLGSANTRVLIFNFGSSLTNTPTVTNSPVLTGVTNSRNVAVTFYQNKWYLIVANLGNSFVIFDLGTSLSTSLTHVKTQTLLTAGVQITDIKTIVDCDTLRILGSYGPAASSSFFKVDFPNDFNSPFEAIFPLGVSATPINIDYGYDGNRWFVFLHFQNAAYRRLLFANKNFGSILSNNAMPSLTGMTDLRGMKLIKQNSVWHLFFTDRTIDSLSHFIFPEPNHASTLSSTNFHPSPFNFLSEGTKVIDLVSYYNSFNYQIYTDSMLILPSPVANFNYSGACTGNTISFTSNSSISSGSISQYEWDFGDGNTSNLQNPTHSYANTGNFSVQLIVTSNFGCKDTISKNVFYSPGPSANFSYVIGCQNTPTLFNDISTYPMEDTIVSYFWDFGDGNTSTNANPNHSYSTSGSFIVKLKITSQNGCLDSTSQVINIPSSPTANFSFSQICLGSPTNFIQQSTGNIVSVEMDLGDGNLFSTFVNSHTYSTAGTYNVKLKVTNTDGCVDSIIKQVKVVDIQSVNIQSVADTCQYSNILLDADVTINGDTVTQWIWDFGNGDSAFVKNPVYAYPQSGIFTIKLTVIGGLDCSSSTQTSINIQPAPSADFFANTVCLGNSTTFTDNTTYPGGQSESYRMWYFGNGDSSSAINPVYTYTNPGSYNVKLVVKSNTGCGHETTKSIFVAPIPSANATVSASCLGDSVFFYDASTILPIDSIVSWSWDIQGHGIFNSQNISILPTSTDSIFYHLTVSSSNGCSDNFIDTLIINGVDFNFSNNSVCAFSEIQLQNSSTQSHNYQWDFCLGDLNNLPKREMNYSLLDARSLNFVKDSSSQNWYAFVLNPDGLVRLDFGNSVNNTPTYNVLGTFGITSSMFSKVAVAYDGSKWMGFMGNASNRLIVFDFGSSITNIPTSTTTPVLSGVTNARNVDVFQYQGQWYIIVVNLSSNITVFTCGTNLNSSLTHLQTVTSSISGTQFTDIKSIVKCGSIEVLLMNFNSATSSINKLSFSQMSLPPIETVFTTNINANLSSMVVGYDNLQWNIFMFPLNGIFRRMVLNNSLTQQDTVISLFNPNLTDVRGSALIKEQSTWYLFLIDRNSDSLVKYVFPDTCSANITYSNQFQPTGVYYETHGEHNVELSGFTQEGIQVFRTKSITITPAPVIQVQISNTCEKSPTTFENNTTYVDTSVTINYLWDFGDGNFSTDISPVHYYDSTGIFTVKLTASISGLCSSQDSFVVTIYPRPEANFQFSTACANSPVVFTNLSNVNGDTIVFYKWEFGDGTFSLDMNPSHNYLIGGTYDVNLITITSNGCVDTATQTILVPRVNFTYQNTCLGQTVDFQSDLFYPNDTPTGYQWFINNQPVSTQSNFSYFFTNIGSYNVKLVVQTQNGCTDSTIKIVDIIQQPIANFQVVGATCANDTVLFVDNSTLSNRPIALRVWDFGDGNIDTTAESQTYHAFANPGNYNVTLTIVTTTNCTSSVTLPVKVGATPMVGFTKPSLLCNNRTFILMDTSSAVAGDSIVSYYWDLGQGYFSTNRNLEYQYSDTGYQVISLTVTTQAGCSATVYDTLYFQQQPKANFTFTQDTFLTIQPINLQNQSLNAQSYIWLRSDSSFWISTDSVPTLQFDSAGTYYLTLIAMNDSGCSDTVTKPVVVVLPVDTIMDIAVLDLQTSLDSAGILTVGVKIKNKSTVPVNKVTMVVRLGQEVANQEFYLGNILPGEIEEYLFKANIITNPYEKLTYICVEGQKPNDLEDVYPQDNVICKALSEEFFVQIPYPNPSKETINIPYILPAEDIVRIKIVNELGQEITLLKEDFGNKGLNIIQADISKLSSGAYMVMFEFQGKFLVRKFVKY